ncbi:MAG TPA: hypothetical protein VK901_06480 [Nitrospiraceae bacterium]|nr:hypothetical protein [Nitrospiraceae bacterium]
MTCSRCLGLMAEDHFLDIQGAYGEMWTTSLRCMNCGHIHDAVIAQHRLAQQEKVLVVPSVEPDYQDEEVHLGAESFIRRAA